MAQYFHAFRIDHILGFFRIWEIPGDCVTGLLGRFYPSIPITREELEQNGIWDFGRLTEPYIRSHLLHRHFGWDAQDIQTKFFEPTGEHSFRFRPEYSSEKAIAKALPTSGALRPDEIAYNQRIRAGLMLLVQNVVLLRDSDDPNKFYPRIELHKTSSYAELEPYQKEVFYRLYVDYFYHRQEGLWTQTAMRRLPVMVHTTKMLCCGEDLGMVPKAVAPVMKRLNILGLRIQRMPDDPKREFAHPSEYDYMTVCTPSVHDTSTVRGWWEEDPGTTQRFYNYILGFPGPAPAHCEPYVMSAINGQHLASKSMWAVFPLQDLFGLKMEYIQGRDPKLDRINIPAIAEHYWRYRMHMNVEDLLKDEQFSNQLRELLRACGR